MTKRKGKIIELRTLDDNLNHATTNNERALQHIATAQRSLQSAVDRLLVNEKRFGWASNSITPQRRKGSV